MTHRCNFRQKRTMIIGMVNIHKIDATCVFAQVLEFCQNCIMCIEKKGEKHHFGELIDRNNKRPWDRIYVDLWGPINPESRKGKKYVLSVKDAFSRFVIFEPIKSKEGKVVAEALARIMICWGVPGEVYSDNGREFRNSLQEALAKNFGFNRKFTVPFSPWSNRVERAHATLGSLVRIYMSRNHRDPADWDEVVPLVAGLMNQRVNSATGCRPNDLMLTYRPRQPFDLMAGNGWPENVKTLPDFMKETKTSYETLAERAEIEQAKQYARLKRQYQGTGSWSPGDHCLFLANQAVPGISKKITPCWTLSGAAT